MGTLRSRIVSCVNDQVWIDYEYDNVANRITAILYANETVSPAEVELITASRTIRQVIPAGVSNEVRVNLSGQNRLATADLNFRTAWPALGP